MKQHSLLVTGILGLILVALLNAFSGYAFFRWDLTEDQRFTLSQPSIEAVQALNKAVTVEVLLHGDLPSEFARLKQETLLLLEQYAQNNGLIKYTFRDPVAEAETNPDLMPQLQAMGLKPASVTVEENNRVSQEVLFPWALVTSDGKTEKVSLLRNQLGADMEARINNSIQNLEFAFSDAFSKLGVQTRPEVAILKGNGELEDIFMADFITSLQDYYNVAPFTLDSVASIPEKTLEALKNFDALVIAKPTQSFSDPEKLVLDQYMVSGGKTLWLIDAVGISLDSLLNEEGEAIALPLDLNLNDLLFRYGIRLNPNLVSDLYATQIVLATGEGNDSQYDPVPWVYHPMVFSPGNHPVNTNIEALRMQFAGSLDTLENGYSKTVLLRSSPLSRLEGAPKIVSLKTIQQAPDQSAYGPGGHPLAVLVEGPFRSAYMNRVLPTDIDNFIEEGPDNKAIFISDGDLIANQVRNGRPLELGYDKWTNNFFGNKDFLMNSMNYLLSDTGLINIRAKQVSVPLLDPEKVSASRTRWQLLNIGIPLVLILLLGGVVNWLRRRAYT